MTLTEFLKEIADAIRAKKGTTDLINPQNFVSEIESIESGGGSITSGVEYLEFNSNYNLIKAKVYGDFVSSYAFSMQSELISVELPSGLTRIGDYCFNGCKKLTLAELPDSLTYIGDTAFNGCSNISFEYIPSGVTDIGYLSFGSCPKITQITFKGKPNSINSGAFSKDVAVINVPWAEGEVANAPWGATNATINYNYGKEPEIKMYTIRFLNGDTVLQESEWEEGSIPTYDGAEPTKTDHTFIGWTPSIVAVTENADYQANFKYSKSITRAFIDRSIPNVNSNVTSVKSHAFMNCSALTTANLPLATSIGKFAFNNCSSLTTLILRSETICVLVDVNAFYYTPIKNGGGYIYVPKTLIEDYKVATNWTTYANQFRAIEDYPEICGGGN